MANKNVPFFSTGGIPREFGVVGDDYLIPVWTPNGLWGAATPSQVPTGAVYIAATKVAAENARISRSVQAVQTEGYSTIGDGGAALYVRVSSQPSHEGKFRSRDGAWWELSENRPTPQMFGARGNGVTDDATAFQNLFNYSLFVVIPATPSGYRIMTPTNLRAGQRVFGVNMPLVFRDNKDDHIFRVVNISDVTIFDVAFTHNYDMSGNRSNKSCIYGLNSSKVMISNCKFFNTGLFAVSSDVSGDAWQIVYNRFERIAGTCTDIRGGRNHIISNNIMIDTGDDAIAVAGKIKDVVVANNTIRNPGQIHTGGGGIRTNGGGVTIIGNIIYNANLFFITCASLSTDGTARPDRVIVKGNVGYGIKPTTNNTTACMLIKNCDEVDIEGNNFDPRGPDNDITITNVVNNGANDPRYTTATPHGYTTGNVVRVEGVVGVTGANGSGAVTVIDANTFDIAALSFAGAYVSGGVAFNAINGLRCYTGDDLPARSDTVRVRGNVFKNVEELFFIYLLGVRSLEVTGNLVDTYNDAFSFLNNPSIEEILVQRNRFKNPRRYGLFYGSAANAVTLSRLIMHDNEVQTSDVALVPINFAGAPVTYAESLRNSLSAATTAFSSAGAVAEFMFDGDGSRRRYNQGTGSIAMGAAEATIAHGLGYQPLPSELSLSFPSGASAVLLIITDVFSTNFKVKTNTAAAATINFNWTMQPVTRRYVNGVLA